jgi:hypothetical protein
VSARPILCADGSGRDPDAVPMRVPGADGARPAPAWHRSDPPGADAARPKPMDVKLSHLAVTKRHIHEPPDDPMTALRVLAGEQGRPAPAEPTVRDALARALSAS